MLDNTQTPPLGTLATRGFQVFGSGDGAKAYLTDYAIYPNQVETATVGDSASPTALLFVGTNLVGRVDQILVSPDQKSLYVSSGTLSGAGQHLNRWIYGTNPAGGTTEWYLDPVFGENTAATASLVGKARGLAFSSTGDQLWVTQNGGANSPSAQNYLAKVTLTPLAQSIVRAKDALAIISGITTPTLQKVRSLDTNADGRITLTDAVAIIRVPTAVGVVTERIPVPAGAPLPVTLDVDPKGNLVVGANSSFAADGSTADVFYVVAPPDYGSQDKSTSAAFTIG